MDRNHSRRIAVAALCLLLGGQAAQAQDRPPEFDSYVIPGWTFTPGISFSGMWDSNVALAGRAAETGRTAGDNLLVFVPFGQLDLTCSRTEFTAGYRGYLRRYTEVDGLNGYDQRAFLALRRMATPRVTWFVQNEYSAMPTTDQVELNGLPFLRVGSKSNRFGAGVESRLTKYTALNVRYDNTWSSFDRVDGFLSGGTINSVGADLTRRLTERTSVGVEGRIRRSDLTRVDPRVIWFQDGGATVAYKITTFTSVSAAAGVSYLRDSRFDEGRVGPYYRLEMDRKTERLTGGVAFERSYSPSFGFSGSNDNQELRGHLHMPFSRNRFYVQGNGAWRRSHPFFVEEIRLDTFVTNATVGYAATRWLRLEAFHGFSRQDSIITGGEVNRHRAGAQLVISQPMRIR